MATTLDDASMLVVGMVLSDKLMPSLVNVRLLKSPYDKMVSLIAEGRKQDALINYLSECQAALQILENYKQIEPSDALTILETAYVREYQRRVLENQLKRIMNGEDIEWGKIQALIELTPMKEYRTLAEILSDNQKLAFRRTFYPPFDAYLGDPSEPSERGFPESSLVIVAGSPGSGKTSLIAKVMARMAQNGKKVLFYSLEMKDFQAAKRIVQTAQNNLDEEAQKNIIICDQKMTASELHAEAMRQASSGDIYAIFVDFADFVIPETSDNEEVRVAQVYRKMAWLARENASGAPVVLLAQLNRNYVGDVPHIHDIRWSGLAEALAAIILLVHNPSSLTFIDVGKGESRLRPKPNIGYVIVGKSRFGFLKGHMGAIEIPFDVREGEGWKDDAVGWIALTNNK